MARALRAVEGSEMQSWCSPRGETRRGQVLGDPSSHLGHAPLSRCPSWLVSQWHGATPSHVWVGSELLEPKELTLLPSYRAPAPATAAWGQPQQPPSIGAAPGWPTSFVLPSRAGDLFAFLLAAAGSPSAKKPPRMLNPGLEAVDS